MKKLLQSFVLLFLLLLLGCEFASSSSEFPWESKNITFNALSSRVDTIKAGDTVEVFFAFTAEEYITDENVSISITNSNGSNMRDYFTVTISDFSEKEATLYSQKCSFTIESDFFLADDYYRVSVSLTLGSERVTKVYYILIGRGKPVAIDFIDDLSVEVGKSEFDTIYAKIVNGPHLTKGNFVAAFQGTSGIQPDVSILSFENDSLALEISTRNVVSGEYTGILGIPIEGVEESFTVEVSDVQFPQIKSVNNISLKTGEIDSTVATILYGQDVTVWDFEDIEVDSAGSMNSFPDWPTAEVSSYEDGVATIVVDAWGVEPGVYSALLQIENSSKTFYIFVEEDDYRRNALSQDKRRDLLKGE